MFITTLLVWYRTCPPRQTDVSDWSKVIQYMMAPRLEHTILVVRVEQCNHSRSDSYVTNNVYKAPMKFSCCQF